jgi:hypothetical protein
MMSWPSDEEILATIVAQTAEFRFHPSWAGGRRLLMGRGIDPMRCLRLSCDQGFDVNFTLVLPDGVFVSVDMREDPHTRELVAIEEWEEFIQDDREGQLARAIVLSPEPSSFDRRVQEMAEGQDWQREPLLPPIP